MQLDQVVIGMTVTTDRKREDGTPVVYTVVRYARNGCWTIRDHENGCVHDEMAVWLTEVPASMAPDDDEGTYYADDLSYGTP